MDEQPRLLIVQVEPPKMECSDCRVAFHVNPDSLRDVLAAFRAHIKLEHPPKPRLI